MARPRDPYSTVPTWEDAAALPPAPGGVPTPQYLAAEEQRALARARGQSVQGRVGSLMRKFDAGAIAQGLDAFGPAGSGASAAMKGIAQLPRVAAEIAPFAASLQRGLPGLLRTVPKARYAPEELRYAGDMAQIMGRRATRQGYGGYVTGKKVLDDKIAQLKSPGRYQQGDVSSMDDIFRGAGLEAPVPGAFRPIDELALRSAQFERGAFTRPVQSRRAGEKMSARLAEHAAQNQPTFAEQALVRGVKTASSPMGARLYERANRLIRGEDDGR